MARNVSHNVLRSCTMPGDELDRVYPSISLWSYVQFGHAVSTVDRGGCIFLPPNGPFVKLDHISMYMHSHGG